MAKKFKDSQLENLIISLMKAGNKTHRRMGCAVKPTRAERGQGLLEFALIVLFLVLLLFGAFDVGRIFHTKIVISNAAREAARFLVQNPDDNLISASEPVAFDDTRQAAIDAAQNSAVSLSTTDILVSGCSDVDPPDDGCDHDQTIQVTINKTYSFFLSDMLGTTLPLSSFTRMYLP